MSTHMRNSNTSKGEETGSAQECARLTPDARALHSALSASELVQVVMAEVGSVQRRQADDAPIGANAERTPGTRGQQRREHNATIQIERNPATVE